MLQPLVPLCLLLLGALPMLPTAEGEAPVAPAKAHDPSVSLGKPQKAPERVWPAQPGEAAVCLWQGDRLAAFTVTIDDNCAGDHPFWIEMGERFGMRFTWFVITERVGGSNAGFNGTWEGWRKLHELGHDIQSHSHTHLHGQFTIEEEYALSKAAIEANIPGHRARFLAYPGGKHEVKNDPEVAKKHYLGARGVTGFVNPAIGLPYMQTGKPGGYMDGERSQMETYFDPKHRNYRGWHIALHHLVGDNAKQREQIVAGLTRIKERAADIWVGTFAQVLLYARERDAATVKTVSADASAIVLALTDTLDDALFDQPLTMKVRLDPAWTTCQAGQQDKALPCTVIEHEGARFALVDALPDRGPVTLKP